jgi:hypothetical protein
MCHGTVCASDLCLELKLEPRSEVWSWRCERSEARVPLEKSVERDPTMTDTVSLSAV